MQPCCTDRASYEIRTLSGTEVSNIVFRRLNEKGVN